MAYRSNAADIAQRERREQTRMSSPAIGSRFPKAGAFAVELRFTDPSGALSPSSFRQLYDPDMPAYFDLRCPLHECSGGGFAVHEQIAGMLANPALPRSGAAACRGSRPRNGNPSCGLELTFKLTKLD